MRRLLARAIRLPLRLVPQGVVLPVLSGPLRGSSWITGAATHGCWLGTYERLTQRVFVEVVNAGSVVYDIGANVGFFSLLASKLAGPAGQVYAFEPLPRNLTYLREHIRMNGAANVEVLNLAISDRDGVARFGTRGNPAMGTLSGHGDVEVRTTTLDRLSQSGTMQPPDFIKMDIEGAEHAALSGAIGVLREARPLILLSAHGYVQNKRCGDLLRSCGYDLEILLDGAIDGDYLMHARPR